MNLLIAAAIIVIIWMLGYAFYWKSSKEHTNLEKMIHEIDQSLEEKSNG